MENLVSSSVKVVVRIRPTLAYEREWAYRNQMKLKPCVFLSGNEIDVVSGNRAGDEENGRFPSDRLGFSTKDRRSKPRSCHRFQFDKVFDADTTQERIYSQCVEKMVDRCTEGFNATILAYGQTGSGKTYTIDGVSHSFENRGMIPRAVEQIFSRIDRQLSPTRRFLVRVSYFEIYKDVISDLLKPDRTHLQIREISYKGQHRNPRGSNQKVQVHGLSEWIVKSPQEMYKILNVGAKNKKTRDTCLNKSSSRGHTILKVIVEQSTASFCTESEENVSLSQFQEFLSSDRFHMLQRTENVTAENFVSQIFKVGTLTLVDLAGSERVSTSTHSYIRSKQSGQINETKSINRSLAALSKVIHALSKSNSDCYRVDKKFNHIPYRDSKLTRILQDSVGGNCLTLVVVLITPHELNYFETLSSLKFARKARTVKNSVTANRGHDANSLLKIYERELKKLRHELKYHRRSKQTVDMKYNQTISRLLTEKKELIKEKKKYEKMLENRSLQYIRERMVKQQLEKRLMLLNAQVITYQNREAMKTSEARAKVSVIHTGLFNDNILGPKFIKQ